MPMHLKLQYHGYGHCQYDEVDHGIGDNGRIPHWELSNTLVAIVWFDQSSDGVACKKTGAKEQDGPTGDVDRHYVRPDSKTSYPFVWRKGDASIQPIG